MLLLLVPVVRQPRGTVVHDDVSMHVASKIMICYAVLLVD